MSTYHSLLRLQILLTANKHNILISYLVCENQKNKAEFCPSTAIISVDINENWLRSNIRHNHFPPIVDIPVAHLRRSIGIAGTTTGRLSNSIRHIYNNEIVE